MSGLQEAVIVCNGSISDPKFSLYLAKLKEILQRILHTGKETFTVKNVEKWNSVRVTFNLPTEAASRLHQLAQDNPQSLRALGISSLQVEGNQLIYMPLSQNGDAGETANVHETAPIIVSMNAASASNGEPEPSVSAVPLGAAAMYMNDLCSRPCDPVITSESLSLASTNDALCSSNVIDVGPAGLAHSFPSSSQVHKTLVDNRTVAEMVGSGGCNSKPAPGNPVNDASESKPLLKGLPSQAQNYFNQSATVFYAKNVQVPAELDRIDTSSHAPYGYPANLAAFPLSLHPLPNHNNWKSPVVSNVREHLLTSSVLHEQHACSTASFVHNNNQHLTSAANNLDTNVPRFREQMVNPNHVMNSSPLLTNLLQATSPADSSGETVQAQNPQSVCSDYAAPSMHHGRSMEYTVADSVATLQMHQPQTIFTSEFNSFDPNLQRNFLNADKPIEQPKKRKKRKLKTQLQEESVPDKPNMSGSNLHLNPNHEQPPDYFLKRMSNIPQFPYTSLEYNAHTVDRPITSCATGYYHTTPGLYDNCNPQDYMNKSGAYQIHQDQQHPAFMDQRMFHSIHQIHQITPMDNQSHSGVVINDSGAPANMWKLPSSQKNLQQKKASTFHVAMVNDSFVMNDNGPTAKGRKTKGSSTPNPPLIKASAEHIASSIDAVVQMVSLENDLSLLSDSLSNNTEFIEMSSEPDKEESSSMGNSDKFLHHLESSSADSCLSHNMSDFPLSTRMQGDVMK